MPDDCFNCPMWERVNVQRKGENSPSYTDRCIRYKKLLDSWDVFARIKPDFCKGETK